MTAILACLGSQVMAESFEQVVRLRAYEIWVLEGCTGDPVAHWLTAKREVTCDVHDCETSSSEYRLPDNWNRAIDATVERLVKAVSSRRQRRARRPTRRH
jgi:hypothetical protein